MPQSTPLIHMSNVRLRRNGREILAAVDWTVRPGEHWAVIGANASGKTTLLQIAGGVLFPTAGEVAILGERLGACDMLALRRRVGWVSSALLSRLPPSETTRNIVVSGLKATFGLVYEHSREDAEKAEETLVRVGVADRMNAPFGVLSQGERQKVLFARAMMAEPELYILDEACSGLDLAARESFLRVVNGVIAAGRAGVVMVTHRVEEIPPDFTHALVLRGGRVLAAGPIDDALASPVLSEAFGIGIAVDKAGGRFAARVKPGGCER